MDRDEHEKMVGKFAAAVRAKRHQEDHRLNKNMTLAVIVGLCASPFAFHAMFNTGYYVSTLLGLGVATAIYVYLK